MAANGWKGIDSLEGLWHAGIYALKHKPSGRVLVCGTTNVYKRLWDDIKALNNGVHYNVAVRRDLKVDGPQAFEWWLVQKVGVPDLLKLLKAYHVEEMTKQGLSYNVKPAVPKQHRRARRIKAPDPDPPTPTLLKQSSRMTPKRLVKTLLHGLPSVEKNCAARVDELLRRVKELRDTGWGV